MRQLVSTQNKQQRALWLEGRLTEHFTWREMTWSPKCEQRGIDNRPGEDAKQRLQRLCRDYLEPLRAARGRAVIVNSAYRTPQLNAAVEGSRHSWHLLGCAVDISCATMGEAVNTLTFFRKHYVLTGRGYDECYAKKGRQAWYVHLAVDLVDGSNRLRDNVDAIRDFGKLGN
jgi:hypothetical protein